MFEVQIHKDKLVEDIKKVIPEENPKSKKVLLDVIRWTEAIEWRSGVMGRDILRDVSSDLLKYNSELQDINKRERLLTILGMVALQEGDMFILNEDVYNLIYS